MKVKDRTATVKPKRLIKWVLVVVAVLAAAAAVAAKLHNRTDQVVAENNLVEVGPVRKRDLSETISLKGTISGISQTNVTSKALSEVTSVSVQIGDTVEEGDLLCTLDSSSIEKKIAELEKSISNTMASDSISARQAQQALERAQQDKVTQLEDAQREINEAQENYNGAQMMYDKGEYDFATLINAERALETAKENYDKAVESADRAIADAQTALEQEQYRDSDSSSQETLNDLKEQLADCEITAPGGGVVTAVNVSVGDMNAEKVTLLTIEDTSSLKLVTTVEEADILKISEGMKATVTAAATGDEEINGEVSRVVRVKGQAGAGEQSSSDGYSVEISIDNTSLLIGMEAKAKIMIQERGEVLAVPYDLIRYDEDGSAYVLVAEWNEDGSATATRKDIEVGEEVDYYTEVIAGSLKEGDLLIYDYSYSIMEGQTFLAEQLYSEQDLESGGTEAVTGIGDGTEDASEIGDGTEDASEIGDDTGQGAGYGDGAGQGTKPDSTTDESTETEVDTDGAI